MKSETTKKINRMLGQAKRNKQYKLITELTILSHISKLADDETNEFVYHDNYYMIHHDKNDNSDNIPYEANGFCIRNMYALWELANMPDVYAQPQNALLGMQSLANYRGISVLVTHDLNSAKITNIDLLIKTLKENCKVSE